MKITNRTTSPTLFSLLTLTALFVVSSAPPPSPPLLGGCVSVLVSFSPCLTYVSPLPNSSTNVSSLCCTTFVSLFESDDAACLCYLLRQPLLLGFPLNRTRILSLPSVCPPMNALAIPNSFLESLCSALPALPPLGRITIGSRVPLPPPASGSAKSPPPLTSLPPEPAESSPTIPSPPLRPATNKPAANIPGTKQTHSSNSPSRHSQILTGIITFLAITAATSRF